MVRLPPLNSLRAFEVAARHLSFTLAADELCVTQGAVSRHIAKLEEHVGTPLFVRKHRQVELTSEGAAYLREVQDAFIRISYATSNLTSAVDQNTLRIKTPPSNAIWWLVPRLGRFHARFPDIQVQLMTSHVPVNFDDEDVDVALQYGVPRHGRLIAERLFSEVMVPVCSPALVQQAGPFTGPADIARQVLLHSIRRPSDWRRWLEAAGAGDLVVEKEIVFENSALTYQGAIDGVGVALAQLAFVLDELPSDRLITPLDIRLHGKTGYYLVFPPHKERLRRVKAFREWVIDEAGETRKADPYL
ncbi:transcriptional regulator GcvA [Microbaculum marinum]|uniref:Transcriptional regulator GcvA n=1 Tax=Microbaculum marinum TaxID=1764581 RepID=A0AAW9RNZ7_9HYPH